MFCLSQKCFSTLCDAFLLKRVISSHNSCLADFEKNNCNKILQLNQNNVNLTFDNYLNNMNALHVPQKNSTKNSFNKNHGSQEASKNQFIKKIKFLKNILLVTTTTIYQLLSSKAKKRYYTVVIIPKITLKI